MIFVSFLEYYFLAGIAFAVIFLLIGYKSINPQASASKLRVRLLWTPAAIALWPLLIVKWMRIGASSQ